MKTNKINLFIGSFYVDTEYNLPSRVSKSLIKEFYLCRDYQIRNEIIQIELTDIEYQTLMIVGLCNGPNFYTFQKDNAYTFIKEKDIKMIYEELSNILGWDDNSEDFYETSI